MALENVKLAYGVAYSSSSKGFLGAVLITDYKGFPLEFRYTDPIAPTKIQQVLYGEGLEKYLKIDVITDSLIKALSSDINVLFVEDEDILNYRHAKIPIVRISATKASPLSETGDYQLVRKNEVLLQASASKSPVRLLFEENFDVESHIFDSVKDMLVEAGRFMDVEEPLSRVQKTLELICNQEI